MGLKEGLKGYITSDIKEENIDDFIRLSLNSFDSDIFVKNLTAGKFTVSDGGQIVRILSASSFFEEEEILKVISFCEKKGFHCIEENISKTTNAKELFSEILALNALISFVYTLICFFEEENDES
ncbi:MAG: hypothetical protein LBD41_02625 [Clostridiales Family XIII bacterium]|jgi:hypothetical protein|nr:hypothetical protein [Clostridiales Family XIII bacterium]